MKCGDRLHGFTVTRVRNVDEADSEMIEMEHDRTGARLIWMKNDGDNKLFSIGFKTVPFDDTGVFHILEHSVLNGSKRYPVKEPFLELLKSSMNTFLNALTFPDKTVFPVSSRNDTDFMNLTKVYLDAVFEPEIYNNPCIFEQEGWHIEKHSENDVPSYNGVVYNEMKGDQSSIFSRIETETSRMMFPDNCYSFVSGGDPGSIPDLTYDKFIETHRKFYHPSNSYIYIDGPVNINDVLSLIDGDYLSKYERNDDRFDINIQKQIAPTEKTIEFDVSKEESEEHQSHIVWSKVIGNWQDRNKISASTVLENVLMGSNESPLKRALLDTGLCADASMSVEDSMQQIAGYLHIMNTDLSSKDKLKETIYDTVRELARTGLDPDDLNSVINQMEFRMREGNEPKGLERNFNVFSSWLYGGDPITYLKQDDLFSFLREKIGSGYYEDLLSEWLLDEKGRATLYCIPSHTYGNELMIDEKEKLAKVLENKNKEQLDDIVKENVKLDEWQHTADTPEDLAKLPRLPISEVDPRPEIYKTEFVGNDDINILFHPSNDKGVVSLNLYFSIADYSEEEVVLLNYAAKLLGNLATRDLTGKMLIQKIKSLIGDLSFSVDAYSRKDEATDICVPFFTVRARFLEQNTKDVVKLLLDILNETRFDNYDQIHEILTQIDENFKYSIVESGHVYSMRRAKACLSAESAFCELTGGYEGYKRLHSFVRKYDGSNEPFTDLIRKAVCRKRLTMSVTSRNMIDMNDLISGFCDGEGPQKDEMKYDLFVPSEQGIIIPSQVAYSGMVLSKPVKDVPMWQVASTVLSFEYLWNEVRVKGGAYGTGASTGMFGEMSFYSYRDPSPKNTMSVYRNAGHFIEECSLDQPALESYIISTIASREPLISESQKGIIADNQFFRGITYDERLNNRKKMLSLKIDELKRSYGVLQNMGAFCIVGPEDKVRSCSTDSTVIEAIE